MKYRKKKFSVFQKSFNIAYAYVVEAFCNDYHLEHLRLGIFASFDEALAFIAKSFYETTKDKISYLRESDNTWLINNDEIKNQSIRHRITDDCVANENVDARKIYIRVDTSNFILLQDGRLAQISEPCFHDQIFSLLNI